jgi:type IX secretion system PorP/SprF family membrane protein
MIKRNRWLIALLMLLCSEQYLFAQQDVQFSQYIFNPLALNTAYAGYRGATYANAMYRSQWEGMKGAPQTSAASVEWLLPERNNRVALSCRILSNELGPQKTISAYGGYTYRIQLDEADTRRLCIGIGAGISQYNIDGTAFEYVDANDPMVPVGNLHKIVPDANLGIYYYSPSFYISAGGNNILTFNNSNKNYTWLGDTYYSMEKKMHLYLGSGYVFPISDNVKLRPSFLWKEDFKGPSNIDLNAFFLFHDLIWLGASYRTGISIWNKSNLQNNLEKTDAFSLMTEFYISEKYRIGYAYDITTSKLNSFQNGTHEISIGLTFRNKEKMQTSPRYF